MKGDCCQSESDPAICFFGDPHDVSKHENEAIQEMRHGVEWLDELGCQY